MGPDWRAKWTIRRNIISLLTSSMIRRLTLVGIIRAGKLLPSAEIHSAAVINVVYELVSP